MGEPNLPSTVNFLWQQEGVDTETDAHTHYSPPSHHLEFHRLRWAEGSTLGPEGTRGLGHCSSALGGG